jgi:glycosyltransferase involved in cell wall biosynthesis
MHRARVLFIEHSEGLSGSTVSLAQLVSGLDRERYDPLVVLSWPDQAAYLRDAVGGAVDTTVIQCRQSLKWTRPAEALIAASTRLGRIARRGAFSTLSVLDLPCVIAPYVARLYAWARTRRIDLIHQNNGFDVPALALAHLLGVPLLAYQRGEEWNSPMVRWLAPRVNFYIANSQVTLRSLLAIGVNPAKTMVIYPPVGVAASPDGQRARAIRLELGIREAAPCFGIVGNLLEWKGQKVFLRAARRVLDAVPRALAVVVGDVQGGPPEYRRQLEALTRELGIEDRTVFTGFRRDVADVMAALDVVVHASVVPEPFGRVIAEAMALGRPVVASRAGGPLEIVVDGENGYLVPPGDEAALAARVIELLRDRRLAREIGERASRDALARFSLAAHVEQVQAVYRGLLTRAPAAEWPPVREHAETRIVGQDS